MLVVCAGGGGIPVVVEAGRVHGVEAVIDKDLAAALLARRLDDDFLLLLIDVPAVELDWGTPRARPLRMATPAELGGLSVRGRVDGAQGRGGLPVCRGDRWPGCHRRPRRGGRDPGRSGRHHRRTGAELPGRDSIRQAPAIRWRSCGSAGWGSAAVA